MKHAKFTTEFRRRRLALDLTYRDLAELTGMSHSYFHHLERIPRRAYKMPAVLAWQISQIFSWSVDSMMYAIQFEARQK